MFTFKNPNTPIIPSDTVVDYGGVKFTIKSGIASYFYSITTDDGHELGLVKMNGSGSNFNWKAGVDAVEARIKSYVSEAADYNRDLDGYDFANGIK